MSKITDYFKVLKVTSIEKSKSLFKELEELIPSMDIDIKYSSIDEGITSDKTIEGNVFKEQYYLKSSENGKKFNYIHELKDDDDLEDVRKNAWCQYDAWKETKKIENIEKEVLETTKN